ncbi:MAG TPA: hypothetical protein VFI56_00915, partial [Vicinamibacterales bacterium]|nr:hypothetical protein [Vicinamibacterales bacterium]
MRMWRPLMSLSVLGLVCVTLITTEASRQDASQAPAAGRGQRGGGRADAPVVGPGNLVTGV